MESIRRRIKIFWLEHSDPIIFYSIVIIVIILIVQFFNRLAIEKNKADEIATSETTTESYSYNTEDKNLIENFVSLCKDNKTHEAYKLLSNRCKQELYPTYEEFINNYYYKMFSKKRTIEINYEKERKLYKITFYTDILESGGLKNGIVDNYKIEQDVLENKIYINFYKNI